MKKKSFVETRFSTFCTIEQFGYTVVTMHNPGYFITRSKIFKQVTEQILITRDRLRISKFVCKQT